MKRRSCIIEDNEQNLYLVTFCWRSTGYEVAAARDGQEGIDLAAAARPDLILLDIQLPVHGRLRRGAGSSGTNPDLTDMPIVAVTSYAMVGDREKALAAGCNGYIEKPINPDTFMQQVEQHLPPRGRDGECQHDNAS